MEGDNTPGKPADAARRVMLFARTIIIYIPECVFYVVYTENPRQNRSTADPAKLLYCCARTMSRSGRGVRFKKKKEKIKETLIFIGMKLDRRNKNSSSRRRSRALLLFRTGARG